MLTPAGQDCKFYYEDFNRGRHRQECRLLINSGDGNAWNPRDCESCRVPSILRANASQDLRLSGKIRKGLMGVGRRIDVSAYCNKHHSPIADPYVGCLQCVDEGLDLDQFIVGSDT